MTTIAPAALVAPIARQPLPFGLFSVLTFRPAGAARWENGVVWETITCDGAEGYGANDCATPPTLDALGGSTTGTNGSGSPFGVYGWFNCSPVGWTVAQAEARALEHLQAREEARVEQALWTGDLGNTPALAVNGVTTELAAGAAVYPSVGLGLLEQWIAENYGSLGMIHASREAATYLLSRGLLVASGGVLRTLLGTPVVAGAGYPGTSPAGADPGVGNSWIYGSPALMGYRSEVFTPSNTPGDLFDRANNDLYAVAERTYVLGFDPCGVAAVQLTADTSGGF